MNNINRKISDQFIERLEGYQGQDDPMQYAVLQAISQRVISSYILNYIEIHMLDGKSKEDCLMEAIGQVYGSFCILPDDEVHDELLRIIEIEWNLYYGENTDQSD